MTKLLILFAAAMLLAWRSQIYTDRVLASGGSYSARRDLAYVLLLVILVLFAGLRTSYNDTGNYIRGYENAATLGEFLATPKNLNIFKNPLFYAYQSLLRSLGFDAQMLIFTTSLLSQVCFLGFFKRYSANFTFTVFLYFTLGTFVFTLAALKQVVAMSILTLAVPQLEKKHWLRYYLLVFLAMLAHTYALAFAVLPLFRARPWRVFTFAFVSVMVVVMLNFKETINAFMEQANELGKTLAEEELFDDHTVNIFRLAVYAVVPALSLFFQRLLFRDAGKMDLLFVHMSILSLAFMSMGTQSGANMFGRMATYFELGTICCLPWMLPRMFDKRSAGLVTVIAVVCFMGYFVYANAVSISFDQCYKAVSLLSLLAG